MVKIPEDQVYRNGNRRLTGDANGDNLVDEADYTIWKSRYGQTVSGAANGDFNGYAKVNGVDYVIWVNYYEK